MLEVHGLDVYRGDVQILWSVSLTAGEGKITALLGPNAAGKTTLLLAVTGLLRPSRGSISLCGQTIHTERVHKIVEMGISMVPEGRRVFPEMSILENLELGAYTRKARRLKRQTLEEVFSIFPVLKNRSRQMAGTLSGGERQMLATARALMSRPRVLLIDELSLGLAPLIMNRIAETIRQINGTMGLTIFMVEQNVPMTLEMANYGYILENGRIAGEGPAGALLEDERVKSAYLGIGGDS
ncbi:MAG: ABC transporter ATP-binding protein [Desulfobacteraceae bacterium]|nr:MAG: ABC transporter ATP-binding protein [Desulfobacteraceae bacterium]